MTRTWPRIKEVHWLVPVVPFSANVLSVTHSGSTPRGIWLFDGPGTGQGAIPTGFQISPDGVTWWDSNATLAPTPSSSWIIIYPFVIVAGDLWRLLPSNTGLTFPGGLNAPASGIVL